MNWPNIKPKAPPQTPLVYHTGIIEQENISAEASLRVA
jgi:hypothetical protein